MARIRLAKLNDTGSVASIESDDMNIIDIVTNKNSMDAQAICRRAASHLRKLASDFDMLATMNDPFKDKTQKMASNKV